MAHVLVTVPRAMEQGESGPLAPLYAAGHSVRHVRANAQTTASELIAALESGEFDVIQFPRLYTLLNQVAKTSGLLEAARARDIATLSASPFGGQILATGVSVEQPLYTFAPALPEVVEAVRRMEMRCVEIGVPLAVAALAYNYTQPLVDVTVPCMVTVRELGQNVAAFGAGVTCEQLVSIAEAGWLDPALIGGPEFLTSWPADQRPNLQALWAAPVRVR
jgi:aryl-alcohol dehydrogenase-like predicted oxidoreductase